jgi:putative flavoprotein involved in K+ transport
MFVDPDTPSPLSAPVAVIGAGQSGLAAARALRDLEQDVVVLEAGDGPGGSWPRYYDSLRVFSPAGYSALPGLDFSGDPERYPTRDDVVDYLRRYAQWLDVDIRAGARVDTVRRHGGGFLVYTADGRHTPASGIAAATGAFDNPHRPRFAGDETFTGELRHVADYRSPEPYAGRRVIVVGAGDSAAQVANELARVATVTIVSRHPLRFIPQRLHGRDIHYWLRETGFDTLPAPWLERITGGSVITDSVGFQETLAAGLVDVRAMFSALDGDAVIWSDGARETVDAIILATGYRPNLGYLAELGALDADAMPLHAGGISTTCLGLVYLGLEFQRSFASNTLRGVSADADAVVAPLVAWVRDAPRAVNLGTSRPIAAPRVRRSQSPARPPRVSRGARRDILTPPR